MMQTKWLKAWVVGLGMLAAVSGSKTTHAADVDFQGMLDRYGSALVMVKYTLQISFPACPSR